jgi:hypothetical protein
MNRAGGLPANLELRMADDLYYGKWELILARSQIPFELCDGAPQAALPKS